MISGDFGAKGYVAIGFTKSPNGRFDSSPPHKQQITTWISVTTFRITIRTILTITIMSDIFQSLLFALGVITFIFAIIAIIFVVLMLIDDKYK